MSPRATPRRRDALAFAGAVVVHLVVLYAPDTGSAAGATPGLDKLVHAAVFAAVTITGLRLGLATSWLVTALLTHAVVSELLQHAVLSARAGDPWDAVADAAGVLLGWAAHRRWGRSTPIEERPGPSAPSGGPRDAGG